MENEYYRKEDVIAAFSKELGITSKRAAIAIECVCKSIPPADVKPVVKGEWMDCADKLDSRSNRHYYECPKCGYYADYFICGSEDWWCAYEPTFCPHCGADMRKEENNEQNNRI